MAASLVLLLPSLHLYITQEYRGTAVITVVRLSPSRDLLAYGTSDGHVRVDKISRSMVSGCKGEGLLSMYAKWLLFL